jgi:NDP-sugar pyrophosphorylase family protein
VRVAVVLAGGLGTRVAEITGPGQPKALLPIAGRPFIEWKLRQLAVLGATDVVLLTGHGDEWVREQVGDGSRYGVRASCHDDGARLLGTGGAVRAVLDRLPEQFWVTYGDSLVEAPLAAVETELASGSLGTMTVLRNEDRFEPSNVSVADGFVTGYGKGAAPGTFSFIDYGLLLFRRAAFTGVDDDAFDLTSVIVRLIEHRQLQAYEVTERFHDIGTVDAWRETDAWARRTDLAGRLGLPAGGGDGRW